jgi:hypothetical protein
LGVRHPLRILLAGAQRFCRGPRRHNPHPHASQIAVLAREPCAPLRSAHGKGCCHTPEVIAALRCRFLKSSCPHLASLLTDPSLAGGGQGNQRGWAQRKGPDRGHARSGGKVENPRIPNCFPCGRTLCSLPVHATRTRTRTGFFGRGVERVGLRVEAFQGLVFLPWSQ